MEYTKSLPEIIKIKKYGINYSFTGQMVRELSDIIGKNFDFFVIDLLLNEPKSLSNGLCIYQGYDLNAIDSIL